MIMSYYCHKCHTNVIINVIAQTPMSREFQRNNDVMTLISGKTNRIVLVNA